MLSASLAGAVVVTYTQTPANDALMLFLGFPLGFFFSGIFGGTRAFLSEFFPTDIRGSGQGFCYNFGCAIGSLIPVFVGYFSKGMPLGQAISLLAGSVYLLVVVAALLLPETKRKLLTGYS